MTARAVTLALILSTIFAMPAQAQPAGPQPPTSRPRVLAAPQCSLFSGETGDSVGVRGPVLNVDPNLAAYLGAWEGAGDDSQTTPIRLVVTEIIPDFAAFVTWKKGNGPTEIQLPRIRDGSLRRTLPDGSYQLLLTLGSDFDTLLVTETMGDEALRATLRRCGTLDFPSAGPSRSERPRPFALPEYATADDVAIVDNVGVVEDLTAVQVDALDSPFVGTLFRPSDASHDLPAVLLLHGSQGGTVANSPNGIRGTARHLAAQGFVTLSLCYFGCGGRPSTLQRIPLEYVFSAIQYLKQLPGVDARAVSVWGESRGAELALLIGANIEVRSVIAVSGSPVVWGGFGSSEALMDCAWTLNEECIGAASAIPVERIDGPVLLFHGEDDAVWTVAFSQHTANALEAVQHPYQLTTFSRVGHAIGGLGCVIGVQRCLVPLGMVVGSFEVDAYVDAARLTFAQTVAFLKAVSEQLSPDITDG